MNGTREGLTSCFPSLEWEEYYTYGQVQTADAFQFILRAIDSLREGDNPARVFRSTEMLVYSRSLRLSVQRLGIIATIYPGRNLMGVCVLGGGEVFCCL